MPELVQELSGSQEELCCVEAIWYFCNKGFKSPDSQAALPTKYYSLVPKNLETSAWNLLQITILVPKILKWLIDYLKSL